MLSGLLFFAFRRDESSMGLYFRYFCHAGDALTYMSAKLFIQAFLRNFSKLFDLPILIVKCQNQRMIFERWDSRSIRIEMNSWRTVFNTTYSRRLRYNFKRIVHKSPAMGQNFWLCDIRVHSHDWLCAQQFFGYYLPAGMKFVTDECYCHYRVLKFSLLISCNN